MTSGAKRLDARDFRRTAIGYLRSSTNEQAERGLGLEAQRASIEAYADANGYVVTAVYSEAASARGPKNLDRRPQLWAAIGAANSEDADLLVSDFGRLTRTPSDIGRITQALPAHRIISVNEGMSLAQPQSLGRLAYHQKIGEQISERTKAAMMRKKTASVISYGNPDIKNIQVSGMEAYRAKARALREALADILEELGNDGLRLSNEQFAKLADDRGLSTAAGNTFNRRNIARLKKDAERIVLKRRADRAAGLPPSAPDQESPENSNPNWGRF
jgi:DNA invertase Pin-like site-specific DNA recombinase